jgi:hypothetical protein
LKPRVKTLEKFIKVAKRCKKINQFNALMAIVSGLNQVSVGRLKTTWERVDSKRIKELKELELFLAPTSNYKVYRAALDDLDPTVVRVPILSLLIKDLFFSNDGNPKYLSNKTEKLINIQKMITISSQIMVFVRTLDGTKINVEDIDKDALIMANNMKCLKEQALYKYSCLCEPKTGDETINLRDKWNQG